MILPAVALVSFLFNDSLLTASPLHYIAFYYQKELGRGIKSSKVHLIRQHDVLCPPGVHLKNCREDNSVCVAHFHVSRIRFLNVALLCLSGMPGA